MPKAKKTVAAPRPRTRTRVGQPLATPPPAQSTRAASMPAPTPDVFARTVPFMVERHSFGEHRKASLTHVDIKKDREDQADVDKTFVNLTKRILQSPKLGAIRQADTRFRNFLHREASTPFRPGLVLVPIGMIETVADRAQQWEDTRAALVEEAALELVAIIESMRVPLGPLFNPMDYPSAARFKAAYWVSWRFIDLGVPNLLREIRADVFAREREKVAREGTKAVNLVQQHLRGLLLEITEHVGKVLTPTADNRFPALRKDSLTDLNQFLAAIEMRDVTNDVELRGLVRQLKDLNMDRAVLKDDEALRRAAGAQVEAIRETLAGLVERGGGRQVMIRDEED